jgi:hypothetical protein
MKSYDVDRRNLYDVFINIRDDEMEHVKTMKACEDNTVAADIMVGKSSPVAAVPLVCVVFI